MRLSAELRRRSQTFGSAVIRLYAYLPLQRDEVRVLGKQLLRSGTSVAAHAREASRARSPVEFCAKIDGLLQEADESSLWLEYLRDDYAIAATTIDPIWQEADELMAIFTTMVSWLRHSAKG